MPIGVVKEMKDWYEKELLRLQTMDEEFKT